jgi:pyruvate dehydrogenase E2 component (dihydrolipoamide acetyltransferase)
LRGLNKNYTEMAVAIKLPRMSDTMEEGTIVSWLVQVGDTVKAGDMIADVETDKATMELENFEKGEVLHLNVEEGETVPVETVIAVVGKKGEDFQDLLVAAPKAEEPASEPVKEDAPAANATEAPAAPQQPVAHLLQAQTMVECLRLLWRRKWLRNEA